MNSLGSILKSRDTTLPTKVRLVKAMVFPVIMHGCESWTIKKAEWRRIDAFGLWCWRRLLRVPWIARRSNQSILEISPGCSLERLMLKLKLQYFGHLMQRADSLEKTLMLGKIEGRRRRGWQRMRWLDGIIYLIDMNLGGLRELVMDREAWSAVIHGVAKSRTRLSDWTELCFIYFYLFTYLFCPPGYVALWDSRTPHRPYSERVSWCLETSPLLRLPFWDGSLSLTLSSLSLSFIFSLTSFWRQWAAFLGAWGPLPEFRSCFVEFAQCSNVL